MITHVANYNIGFFNLIAPSRLIRTIPCVAAFMSSLTVITIAMDRFRFIVSPHKSQVNKWMETSRPTSESSSKELNLSCNLNQTWT